MAKYKALTMYNYYDGPIMFTASAPGIKLGDMQINNIYWLVWSDEGENDVRLFDVHRLDDLPIGHFVETVKETDIDFSEMER